MSETLEKVKDSVLKSEHFVPLAFLLATFVVWSIGLWFLRMRMRKWEKKKKMVEHKARVMIDDPATPADRKKALLEKYCILNPDDPGCKDTHTWIARNWPYFVGVLAGAILVWLGLVIILTLKMIVAGVVLIVLGILAAVVLPLLLVYINEYGVTKGLEKLNPLAP